MIKLVTLIKRKPGVSLDAFKRHEETRHVVLTKKIMGDDLLDYVRNYPVADDLVRFGADNDYDAIIECTFADRAAFERAIAATNRPENRALFKADYEQYLDLASVRQSVVEVRTRMDGVY